MTAVPWVGLADAVRGVRAELKAAMAEGQEEGLPVPPGFRSKARRRRCRGGV